jgi:hypothetical protein
MSKAAKAFLLGIIVGVWITVIINEILIGILK